MNNSLRKVVKKIPRWILWLWLISDWFEVKRRHYQPVSEDKKSLFRFCFRRYRGKTVTLNDGTIILPGDWVCELHLDNRRLRQEVLLSKAWNLATWRILQQLKADLTVLCERLDHGELNPVVKAFHITTILHPGARRLGFQIWDHPSRLWSWVQAFYMTGLLRLFSPTGSMRLNKGLAPLVAKELWLSKEQLRKQYKGLNSFN